MEDLAGGVEGPPGGTDMVLDAIGDGGPAVGVV